MLLSIAMILGGLAGLVVAYAQGDAELSVVVVIPVLSGTGAPFALGVLLLMGGFFLLFLSWGMRTMAAVALEEEEEPAAPRPREPSAAGGPASAGSQWGGVVFIGPIPIAFGSNPRMNRIMLVAAVVMALLFFVFLLGLFV